MANITGLAIGLGTYASYPLTRSFRKRPRSTWALDSRNGPVVVSTVHPAVLIAAQEARRPGERLVVISPTEVLLTHRQTRSATSDLR